MMNSDLMKAIDRADVDSLEGVGELKSMHGDNTVREAGAEDSRDPESGLSWLIEQR